MIQFFTKIDQKLSLRWLIIDSYYWRNKYKKEI